MDLEDFLSRSIFLGGGGKKLNSNIFYVIENICPGRVLFANTLRP
jgi:hypothetical protein